MEDVCSRRHGISVMAPESLVSENSVRLSMIKSPAPHVELTGESADLACQVGEVLASALKLEI